jgi:hypothetical protein
MARYLAQTVQASLSLWGDRLSLNETIGRMAFQTITPSDDVSADIVYKSTVQAIEQLGTSGAQRGMSVIRADAAGAPYREQEVSVLFTV